MPPRKRGHKPPSCHRPPFLIRGEFGKKIKRLKVPKKKDLKSVLAAMHLEINEDTAKIRVAGFYVYDPVKKVIVKSKHHH